MNTLENMSIEEITKEIKERLKNFKKTKPYVFVSYSKRDCKVVYQKVLEWLRMGYNIYIDMDFENHGSDENWITQMTNKIRDNKCVMATIFKSENYCFSYAALIELLTMRSKETETRRRNTSHPNLPIDVIELSNKLVKNGIEFSSEEVEKKYEQAFEKIREKHMNVFLNSNEPAKEALIEGMRSLANVIKAKDSNDDTEVTYELVDAQYNMGYTNFYPEIAGLINKWFNTYDLNGNNKSINDLSGVISRFQELKVYKDENAALIIEDVVEENIEKADIPAEVFVEDTTEEPVEQTMETSTEENNDEGEETEASKKRKASVTGEVKYYLYGEEFIGNQSDVMIMTFGKVLKKHPEFIERAIEEFTCLSNTDYSVKKNFADMPSYFRVCHTFEIDGKTVCIGTAYGMPDKLKLMAKLLVLVGDEKDTLKIEGIELPEVKLRTAGKSNAENIKDNSGGEVYFISGNKKEGNQSKMMWDVFESLAEKYTEKIADLTAMGNVSLAKDVQNAGTKDAYPTCFLSCKSFMVNGEEYMVGATYNRAEKIRRIYKMISICGAPDDFFVLEGEKPSETQVVRTKKEYSI